MAILDIVTVPHPVLAEEAREVRDDEFGDALEKLCADMAQTMYAAPGVGLAAPQVADGRRIIVVDPGDGDKRGTRLHKMINPKVVDWSRETIFWDETCLSVPGLEVKVERHEKVQVEWRDPDGTPRQDWFEGYEAVIIQHELDHLVGTVLLDRVSRFKRSRYLKRVKRKEATLA